MDRFPARLEERHDAVRTALPGTIQHWNLNLNPPHTRNSGYLRAQVKERARPSLEKHGWEGTTFDASYGLLRVSASASTRATLDASHLAKGIDMLVHVMLPKN
ncbi:hypothetical protein, partial [Burkholderia multivorans]|uniref:hypothetical protein n=1 Tax=Burkholderia multivorans TaxID=87883 RepID=UPI00265DF1F3